MANTIDATKAPDILAKLKGVRELRVEQGKLLGQLEELALSALGWRQYRVDARPAAFFVWVRPEDLDNATLTMNEIKRRGLTRIMAIDEVLNA